MARTTILVADDDGENREMLKGFFDSRYTVALAENGKEAMEYIMEHFKEVAIILLDMHMPVVDGRALLKVLKMKGVTKRIPIVMMTTRLDEELVKECYENGAADFVLKPFVPSLVRGRINNTIAVYHHREQLEAVVAKQLAEIKEKNGELKAYNDRIVEVMSSLVEFRNLESNYHIKKIKGISRILAEVMGALYPEDYEMPTEKIEMIESASALHDIGMVAISDTILLKPGKLSADEFEVIKSHTTLGCEMLKQIEEMQSKEFIKVAHNIVRHHHEKYDGKGYPDHLAGDDIPIEAQIVSMADVYDSLISDKPYRDAFDMNKAFTMLTSGEAGEFNEKLIQVFVNSRKLIEDLCKKYT